MKSILFNGDSQVYEAPEVLTIEVSVENGFAESLGEEDGEGVFN